METFDFKSLNSELKLDVSIFQNHLNSNIGKINSAVQYLFSRVNHQQQSHTKYLQTHTFQQTILNNHQQQIESVKTNQQSIFNEIYLEEDGSRSRRVSRIDHIEKQITKIKQSIKEDNSNSVPSLARLQSRGKTVHNDNDLKGSGLVSSQIRIKDTNMRQPSREKRGDSMIKSKLESRKRIANEIQNREEGVQCKEIGFKSMHTSFMKRKGSRTYINFSEKHVEKNEEEQCDNDLVMESRSAKQCSNSNKKIEEDLQSFINLKMKELQNDYKNRLQAIEKRLKIKTKPSIKFDEEKSEVSRKNLQSRSNNPCSSSQNQPRSFSKQESPEKEQSEQWVDPSQKQFQEMRILLAQAQAQMRKQELEQKELSKKSSDILLKFQKNHERVTAALKYLQRNMNKILQKLKETNIIEDGDMTQLNDDIKGDDKFKGDKVSKLTRVSQKSSPSEKMVNKIEVMDNLVKNIEQQIRQMKYAIGMRERGFLPKIDERESVNRIKQATINRDLLQHVNFKLTEVETSMDKMKVKMKSISDNAEQVPLKLIELGSKMREQSEIRQERLIELIKQIVNRILLDPFNHNFTNHLKKEIYVKFLEIKHQYGAVWKQIEKKVEDRADKKQIEYLAAKYQTNVLEMRSMVSKKTDVEDYRKWVKFVENKFKELSQSIKVSETNQYKLVQEHTLSIKKKEKER